MIGTIAHELSSASPETLGAQARRQQNTTAQTSYCCGFLLIKHPLAFRSKQEQTASIPAIAALYAPGEKDPSGQLRFQGGIIGLDRAACSVMNSHSVGRYQLSNTVKWPALILFNCINKIYFTSRPASLIPSDQKWRVRFCVFVI